MALYLVVHSPRPDADDGSPAPPSRLTALARALGGPGASPRWLRAWSPDLHDDRIFSLWEAESAAQVQTALARYGFLDHLEAQPLQVREWGPEDVLTADG
ncbi:MAG: hypothetical protein AVDCRST_MAG73-3248 [uncultured Thermomicrobiales bacterium]|uniref:Uncharacterized protein n=1 Tax=uncultured Thermomicrobiales bacterium TaxID=1645740 RepID=A0A6J4UN42_9BACT|nr:MAG: hypothetical protein AVDCRST_MAG73-3248 [uncultured Thermomicrobiales bacterium]